MVSHAEQLGYPVYVCHKQVRAGKIVTIKHNAEGSAKLIIQLPDGVTIEDYANDAWMARHKPQEGGYIVFYEDGYSSFSPAYAFELGYTLASKAGASLGGLTIS